MLVTVLAETEVVAAAEAATKNNKTDCNGSNFL